MNPGMVTNMEAGLQSTKTNTETDWVRLQSAPDYLPFWGFFLFPTVFVVLVVFISMLSAKH